MSKRFKYYASATSCLAIAIACVFGAGLIVEVYSADQHANPDQSAEYQHIIPDLSLPQPARSYTDVPYCNTTNPKQTLDIFTPPTRPGQSLPVLIYVHGGGWSSSSKVNGLIDYYKQDLLDRGIAVVSINHRLAPKDTFPAQNQDVECSIGYMHKQAGRYGLDSRRIALFGESSGAQLITAAALNPTTPTPMWKSSIRAVVSFYGISDFQSLLSDKNYRGNAKMYLGKNPQQQALQASVIYRDINNPPPFLIVHGDNDPVIPVNQSKALYRHIQKFSNRNQLLIIKGGGHGITMKNKPNASQLRTITLDYIQRQFANPLSID